MTLPSSVMRKTFGGQNASHLARQASTSASQIDSKLRGVARCWNQMVPADSSRRSLRKTPITIQHQRCSVFALVLRSVFFLCSSSFAVARRGTLRKMHRTRLSLNQTIVATCRTDSKRVRTSCFVALEKRMYWYHGSSGLPRSRDASCLGLNAC